jgi:hypothetical protein
MATNSDANFNKEGHALKQGVYYQMWLQMLSKLVEVFNLKTQLLAY